MTDATISKLEANKNVYRRVVDEVVNQGLFDVVDQLFEPTYVDHGAPPGLPQGLAGVKAVFGMFRTGFSDVHFTIDDMVAQDDIVATLVHGEGTNDGPFMGMPPTGRHARWRSVGFFRVRDGKIVEHWGIPDLLGLMIQLGVIPPPPAESASGSVDDQA
jgi:predicted ester cyclase